MTEVIRMNHVLLPAVAYMLFLNNKYDPYLSEKSFINLIVYHRHNNDY